MEYSPYYANDERLDSDIYEGAPQDQDADTLYDLMATNEATDYQAEAIRLTVGQRALQEDGVNSPDWSNPNRTGYEKYRRSARLSAEHEVELAKCIEAGLFAQHILTRNQPSLSHPAKQKYTQEYIRDLEMIALQGQQAKQAFIEANFGLVVTIARRYVHRGLEYRDLVQEAMFGLIRAVEKFDYTQGYKFSTYATYWIREALLGALDEYGHHIRLPERTCLKIRNISKTEEALRAELDRTPTDQEIAHALGFTIEEVLELRYYDKPPLYWSQPIPGNPDIELHELYAAPPPPPQAYSEQTTRLLAALSEVQVRAVELRLAGKSFEEIGLIINQPRRTAQRTYQTAMEALRLRANAA